MIRKETQVGRAVAILALLLSMRGVGFGQGDGDGQRASLAGIKSVYVVVEDLSDSARVIGLTRETLQTDVELRLRKAGIQVQPSSAGYLYVNVNILTTALPVVAYNVEVEYVQEVEISRLNRMIAASTWSKGGLGMTIGVEAQLRAQRVREFVGDVVDGFINAYLSVNPK